MRVLNIIIIRFIEFALYYFMFAFPIMLFSIDYTSLIEKSPGRVRSAQADIVDRKPEYESTRISGISKTPVAQNHLPIIA